MLINPDRHFISIPEIRARLSLSDETQVIPIGYEIRFTEEQKKVLQNSYDLVSLQTRLYPDYYIKPPIGEAYLVEAKALCKTIEALQLFFNQQYSRMGVNVIYSFPNKPKISSWEIPLSTIIVPANHNTQFIEFLLPTMQGMYPNLVLKYIGYVDRIKGSGDPFISIEGVF